MHEDGSQVAGFLCQLVTSPADRSEVLVDRVEDEALERRRPRVADLVRDLPGRTPEAQRGDLEEVGDLGAAVWLIRDPPFGVGLGSSDEMRRLICARRERDRVAAALAHLATIEAEQERRTAEERFGLREVGAIQAVAFVEPTRDRPCQLEVRQLVLADWDEVRPTEEDVGGLVGTDIRTDSESLLIRPDAHIAWAATG